MGCSGSKQPAGEPSKEVKVVDTVPEPATREPATTQEADPAKAEASNAEASNAEASNAEASNAVASNAEDSNAVASNAVASNAEAERPVESIATTLPEFEWTELNEPARLGQTAVLKELLAKGAAEGPSLATALRWALAWGGLNNDWEPAQLLLEARPQLKTDYGAIPQEALACFRKIAETASPSPFYLTQAAMLASQSPPPAPPVATITKVLDLAEPDQDKTLTFAPPGPGEDLGPIVVESAFPTNPGCMCMTWS